MRFDEPMTYCLVIGLDVPFFGANFGSWSYRKHLCKMGWHAKLPCACRIIKLQNDVMTDESDLL